MKKRLDLQLFAEEAATSAKTAVKERPKGVLPRKGWRLWAAGHDERTAHGNSRP